MRRNEQRPAVLVLHNAPPPEGERAGAAWRESDAAVSYEVSAVEAALARLGLPHRTVGLARPADLPRVLASAPEQVVFNLVEGYAGAPAEAAHVPAFCRAFGKACTGSDTACLVLAQDKWQSKAALQAAGLPCPAGALAADGDRLRHGRRVGPRGALGTGPFIVKPVGADGSEGIDASSVVSSAGPALERAVRRVHKQFRQAALVERFIDGRELNVSLLECRGRPRVLAVGEIDLSAFPRGRPRIVDYAAKWLPDTFEYRHTPVVVPALLSAAQARRVHELALAAWRVMGCRDYARVDFRMDGRGRLFILDVNPNPDVSPDAGFAAALAEAGIPFHRFAAMLIAGARARQSAAESAAREPRPHARRALRIRIRSSQPADRAAILGFVAATGVFRPDELLVAQEVLDDALAKGPGGHYLSFTAEVSGRPVGWVCVGPTPCTVRTFDVYWIAVEPGRQRRGLGAVLMAHAERTMITRGARMAVVETSGRAAYDATRAFYRRLGYRETARLPDFYAPGDDKVVYAKALSTAPAADISEPRP
ncbi:MAG: GNAT family N-acetyltransferase [Planctomycetes bacterium]|nr:GNAT family N-acetyltransferase [Planctomycetota bacterium]